MNESFTLIESKTIPLTLELAEAHRTLLSPPTERPLKEERVKFLRDRAEAGLFLPVSWAIALIGANRAKARINGQHSSTALCRLKENFPKGLQCHYDQYHVKDENGLILLFRQLDNRVSNRTKTDVAAAFQGTLPNLRNLKTRYAMVSVEGIAWWRRHLEGTPVLSGDGMYEIFKETEEHQFIEWICRLITPKTPELFNKAIVAAMYEAWTTDKGLAMTFWTMVSKGSFDDSNHPANKLSDWLKSLKERKDYTPKPGTLYQGCMFAWMAFLEDKSIAAIKSDARRSLLRSV